MTGAVRRPLQLPDRKTAVALAALQALFAADAMAESVTATEIQAAGDGSRTEIRLDLSRGVVAKAYTLANPYRVVVDLPDVAFRADGASGATGGGLVKTLRQGAYAEGWGRIVADTTGPVRVTDASMANLREGGVRMTLRLEPTDVVSFGDGTGSLRARPPETVVKPALFEDAVEPVRTKPVIMIDPGHGGIDPGAVGTGKITEKAVVLAVALQLKAALLATGQYDVAMTRTGDTFVPLDRRVALSEQAKADLFVSLHADAIEDRAMARSVKGASVYILSERASDEQARAMADKENAADLAAGVEERSADGRDEVKHILFDLVARETTAFSHLLSRSVVAQLGKTGALAREPERAAAFRVLKQAHAPSVLIELGFLSHPTEEQQLASLPWQRQVAAALSAAVDTYFARKRTSIAAGAASGTSDLNRGGVLP